MTIKKGFQRAASGLAVVVILLLTMGADAGTGSHRRHYHRNSVPKPHALRQWRTL